MKRQLLVFLMVTLSFSLAFANGAKEEKAGGMKTISFFMGHPLEDYPAEGTTVGNYIEEQTGVKADFEFLVGELEQKVGIMIASGEYPDVVNGRNYHQKFIDAGAVIPLEDLIEEHGPNIKKMYGDTILKLLRKDDGHIYFLPAFVPSGKISKTTPDQGFFIQKKVLKEFGYPGIETVDDYFDLISKYAAKYPEVNGKSTIGFTSLFYSWRNYTVMNMPSVVTGHPNDGSGNVDLVNGKWVVSQYYDSPAAKEIYAKYNEVYNDGLFDPESFVADYDQYQAKLTSGRVLGFFDQTWSVDNVQQILKQEDKDNWYVALPAVLDGYTEECNGPASPQLDAGVSITVSCKDPVAVIEYFDFLCREETQKRIGWGFEGTDYLVDGDGMFYRNEEQRARFMDPDYTKKVTGGYYFNYMMPGLGSNSSFSDGNVFDPRNQPSEFYARLYDSEKEVLDAYHIQTWNELFRAPNNDRAVYYPLWTGKMNTGSAEEIASQKIKDVRDKYTPLLIMADKGSYDAVWNEYLDELNKIKDRDVVNDFYQKLVDSRVSVLAK
ncbi:MAG: extracellular solute-binding protein [Spirochaetales bacterium]|nr:extracellular solute-binding protein [Spirochaetales bacterium]